MTLSGGEALRMSTISSQQEQWKVGRGGITHIFVTFEYAAMNQYGLKQGLKEFLRAGTEPVHKEI